MKHKTYLLLMLLAIITLSFSSCGKDDDNKNPDNGQSVKPDVTVDDPEGTIELAMRDEDHGKTVLDNISIKNENFNTYDDWSDQVYFASLGEVKGLGNVSKIPKNGWAEKVAVIPGYGYVAYNQRNNQYYRIYVTDYISGGEGIIGAYIKYQTPFKGLDEVIDIDEKELTFGTEGGNQSIVFNNQNIILFECESDQPWCRVERSTTNNQYFLYNAVTINVEPNSTPISRTATITLSTVYGKTQTIAVTQTGENPILTFENNKLEFDCYASAQKIGFSTNYNLEDLNISSSGDWLSTNIEEGTYYMKEKASLIKFIGKKKVSAQYKEYGGSYYYLVVSTTLNRNKDLRSATITITSTDKKLNESISVKQSGAFIQLTDMSYQEIEQLNIGSENRSLTAALISSPFEEGDLSVKSNVNWCVPEIGYSMGYTYIQLNISQNTGSSQRKAKITVSASQSNVNASFTVVQEGASVRIVDMSYQECKELTFGCSAYQKSKQAIFLSPFKPEEVTIKSSASWCKAELDESGNILFTLAQNRNKAQRKSTVTFSCNDGDLSAELQVIQEPSTLNLSQSEITVGPAASNTTVNITTLFEPDEITATTEADWCSCTFSKSGNKVIMTVACTVNKSDVNQREATINLTVNKSNLTATLNVIQQVTTVEGPTDSWIDREQHTYNITVKTNNGTSWTTPKSNQSWCQVSSNGNTLTIRCEASAEEKDRVATLTFPDFNNYKLKVHQSRYKVGDNYEVGEVSGTICYMNENLKYICKYLGDAQWSTENVLIGANNDNDGTYNMNVVKKIPNWKELYPAFALVDALNTNTVKGWFFPAKNQLQNYCQISLSRFPWASTESGDVSAYYYYNYYTYSAHFESKGKENSSPVYAMKKI